MQIMAKYELSSYLSLNLTSGKWKILKIFFFFLREIEKQIRKARSSLF